MGVCVADFTHETQCRGCHAAISFRKSSRTGANLPVQRVKKVYRCERNLLGETELHELELPEDAVIVISHFETCPRAGDFTGGKRG